jgi:hypothetical protein
MALAVLAASVLTAFMPKQIQFLPRGVVPGLQLVLLVLLVIADPGRITRRDRWMRLLSIGLVALLMLSALWATLLLVDQLIRGNGITNSAADLLRAGAAVWVATIIAFSLLYWELDGGGAAQRAHGMRRYPDFGFPQQLNPGVGPPGWRPRYVDHFYLAYTNASAFSPTDVMPLVSWAKMTMAVQSTLSIVVLGLVVARAVNIFK